MLLDIGDTYVTLRYVTLGYGCGYVGTSHSPFHCNVLQGYRADVDFRYVLTE